MSENTNLKFFRMKKTVPGEVILVIHPLSNWQLTKTIDLTDRNPFQMLPLDWALGVFIDTAAYNMYKDGYFTFDKNDELVKEAYAAGAFFDDKLDFTPVSEDIVSLIKTVLKAGNRKNIEDAVTKYGETLVREVATTCASELSMGVVNMLEGMFKIQLVLDGGLEDVE